MAWTYKYVDSALGSGDNDGSSEANAWRGVDAVKTGYETNHAAEVKVVYRRTCVFDIGAGSTAADIAPTDDGTAAIPAYHVGMPRQAIPNTTITAADFTNGSRLIDNVTGITPGLRAHGARFITAPDGKKYLITAVLWEFTVDGMGAGAEFAIGEILTNTTQTKKGKVWAFTDNLDTTGTIQAVVDSATAWVNNDNITSDGGGDAELSANATAVGFLIDREYAGGTVTGVDGKFQIDEDEDYAEFHAAGVGATWEADAHDLPKIDFNDQSYQLYLSSDNYFSIRNFYFENSADNGIVGISGSLASEILGCIFKQSSQNATIFYTGYNKTVLNRFIIEGSGAGAAQVGLYSAVNCLFLLAKNGAIYNCGDIGLDRLCGDITLENVNIGSEMANGDEDIYAYSKMNLRDIILGGHNGYVLFNTDRINKSVQIENYQKVLGNHKSWFFGGTWESIAVTSTNANKKLSDTVIKVTPSVNYVPSIDDWKTDLFDDKVVAKLNAGTYTIGWWIFNDLGQTLNDTTAKDNLFLKAFNVSSYDDETEYTVTEIFSTLIDIVDAADADAWVMISVTFTLATAANVKFQLMWGGYDASDYFLVDPQPVIT